MIRSIGLSIILMIGVSIAIGLASYTSVRAPGDSRGTGLLMAITLGGAAANVLILGALLRFLVGEATRRTCTESSLRQSEEQFRGAFDAAACGMALVGTDGRWLRVNRAVCEIVGYNEEELLATTFQAITHRDDLDADLELVRQTLANEIRSYQMEKRYIHKDGHVVSIVLSVSLVRDANGRPLHFVSQIEDVTRRKQAEEAHRLSESTVRSFYDGAPLIMGVVELREDDILIVSANAATAAFHGVAPAALSGRLASDLRVPRTYRREWVEKYRESESTGRPVQFEFRYHRDDGTRFLSATVCHIAGTSGSAPRFSYLVEDVTGRKRAEAFQAAQHAATSVLADAETLEEVVPRLIQSIGECLEMDAGEFWLCDEAAGVLRPGAGWWSRSAIAGEYVAASGQFTFARGEGLPGRVWETGRPTVIEDLTRDPTFHRKEIAARAGFRCAIGLAVTGRSRTIGVVAFLARNPLHLDSSMIDVMATLGRQIGLFIERKRAEAEVIRVNAWLEGLLDASTQVAIISCDLQGVIRVFNTGAERMLGYAREDVIGKTTPERFHVAEELQEHARRLGLGSRTNPFGLDAFIEPPQRGSHELLEWTCVRKDGSRLTVSLVGTALRNADHEIIGYLGIALDVTERKRAEEKLRRAKDAAESASRAKDEFLANMSHEIRTPMNGIIGMTELALETELTSRQREYLCLVRSSADALLTVINDVLDFSKIEAGKLELTECPFNLRETLEDTLRAVALRAHAKGLELACRIAPDLPELMIGDPTRLRQVVVNLVGNAIKFTERGEVVLTADFARGGDSGDGRTVLDFSVADTGVGISADKIGRIFEPFEQADNSSTRRFGGTGLGLAIAIKLVEMMGGTITVESEVGRGSTFHFSVRLERHEAADGAAGTNSSHGLEGRRVLVVDDNATNRGILVDVLMNWRALPSAVEDGSAALDALRAADDRGEPFAAAVIDGVMPVLNGYDLARRIRLERSLDAIALVLMTSDDRPDDPERHEGLGISAWLSKPLRQRELYACLIGALDRSPSSPRACHAASAQGSSILGAPSADVRNLPHPGLRILLAEDHPVNQKVASRMLEGLGHRVSIVGDGRQALDALMADDVAFDIVFMDVQMPVMDGYEVVAALRARLERGWIKEWTPIVALTAHAMNGDRERCLSSGFDAYISKPIRSAELQKTLDMFTRTAGPASAPPEPTEPVVSSAASFHETLLARCGRDEEFARELISSFLESAERSTLAFRQALDAGDLTRLEGEAHGLKGASLTVGAQVLAEMCKTLENACRRGDRSTALLAMDQAIASWVALKDSLTLYEGAGV